MAGNKRNGIKKSTQNLNSKWMRNALKSFGLAGTDIIKEMIPATAETFTSATKLATETARSIRSSKVGARAIGNALSNNPIIKTGQDFLRNAADDLKSGKLYNNERSVFGDDFDFDFDDTDFSFGDMDESNVSEININTNVNNGSNDATIKLMEKQMDYQIKSTKATIDTMVATSSTMLMKTSEIGSAMVSHLESIDTNIAALVQYNSSNMTKFIEASIGFYEQMAGAFKKEESSYGSNKISPDSIYGANGGLDFGVYKDFVKQNIVKMKDESVIGSMVSMVLENKDILISNPLGLVMKGVMNKMVPDAIKAASKELDKTIQDVIPVLLDRIGRLGDNDNSTFAPISRFISKAFGVKAERDEVIDFKKVNDGPIPFNGMAHHAIIDVIPNYLRESNQYLKVIAEHLTGKDVDMSESKYFDWKNGEFRKMKTVEDDVFGEYTQAILEKYENSDILKRLKSVESRFSNKKDAESFGDALKQYIIANHLLSGEVDFSDLDKVKEVLLKSGFNDNQIIGILDELKSIDKNEIGAINLNFNAAKTRAVFAENQVTKHINETRADGRASAITPGKTYSQYFTENIRRNENYGPKQSESSFKNLRMAGESATIVNYDERNQSGKGANLIKNFTDVIKSLGSGNADAAWDNFMQGLKKTVTDAGKMITENFLHPIAIGLFGEKDVNGFYSKGLFSGVQNHLRDTYLSLRRSITGKGFTDSKGEKFEDNESESLKGKVRSIADKMREAISLRLFGNKDYNYENDTESNNKGKSKGLFGEIRWKLSQGEDSIPEMIKRAGKRFTEFMFGKEIADANGKVTGRQDNGIISTKTQQWLKEDDRGKFMAGGALVGGFMGLLTGGPILGVAKGIAGSLLVKSKAWNQFLFGNPETGDVGLKQHAKDFVRNLSIGKDGDLSGGKMFGSLLAGAGAGGLIGMLVGGPVVGAAAGLGTAILAQKENFKEWLFGSEYTDEEGNKHKKLGVLGKFGNMLKVNVFHPIANKVKDISEDIGTFVRYDILNPMAINLGELGERLSLGLNRLVHGLGRTFGSLGKTIKENFLDNGIELMRGVLAPLTTAVTTVADAVVTAGKAVVSAPVKLMTALLSPVTKAVSTVVSTAAKVTFGAVDKLLITPISNLVLKPLGGIVKIAGKVVSAPFQMVTNITNMIADKINSGVRHVSNFMYEVGKKVKEDILNSKFVKGIQSGVEAVRNFTEELVYPVIDLAKSAIGEVKKTIKDSIKRFFSSIFDSFKTIMNPLNWIKALGKIGGGLLSLIPGGDKIGGAISRLNPFSGLTVGRNWRNRESLGSIWARTGAGYRTDNSDALIRDDNGNVIGTTKSWGEERRDNKRSKAEAKEENRQARIQRRAHSKNEKFIAKVTGNQFTEDTEENRIKAEAAARKKGISIPLEWNGVEAVKSKTDENIDSMAYNVALIASQTLGGIKTNYGKKQVKAADEIKKQHAEEAKKIEEEKEALKKTTRRGWFSRLLGLRSEQEKILAERDREKIKDKIQNNFSNGILSGITSSIGDIFGRRKARKDARANIRKDTAQREEAEDQLQYLLSRGYASGTTNAKAGLATVNENGQELIITKSGIPIMLPLGKQVANFAGGEQVINNSNLASFLSDQAARQKKADAHDEEDQAEVSTLTGDAKMAENDAKKKEEEQVAREEAQIQNLEELKEETKEHNLSWLATFGKKGLIVTGILALLPLAKKVFDKISKSGVIGTVVGIGKKIKGFWDDKVKPWWENTVKPWWENDAKPWIKDKWDKITTWASDVLPKVGTILYNVAEWLWGKLEIIGGGIAGVVKSIYDKLVWTKENGALGDGKSSLDKIDDEAKRTGRIAKDIVDGDLIGAAKDYVLDENGEFDHQSKARGNYLTRGILNRIFSHGKAAREVEGTAIKKYGKSAFSKTKIRNYKAQAGIDSFTSKGWEGFKSNMSKAFSKEGAEESAKLATETTEKRGLFSKLGNKVKGFFSKGKNVATDVAASTLDDQGEAMMELIANNADDVSEAVIKKTEKELAENATKETGSKILSKITSALDEVFKFLEKKLPKAASALKKSKAVMSKLAKAPEVFKKLFPRISAFLVGTAGLAATVVGLAAKETTWVILGAVNGVTGAKRLFFTDTVDSLMVTISTAIGAALGTTVGTIFDITNEVIASVTGVDCISELATGVYKVLVTLAGESYKADELTKNQAANQEAFEKYQNETIGSQYELAKAQGKIDKSVTKEQFIQGAKKGEYEAIYDSYNDWNDKTHKNGLAAVGATIKTGAKSVGNAFRTAGGFLFGKSETSYTDNDGIKYVLNPDDDTYSMYDKEGNPIGTIDKKLVDTKGMTKNKEKTSKGIFGSIASGIAGGFKAAGKGISGFISKEKDRITFRKNIWTDLVNIANTGDIERVNNYKANIDPKSSLSAIEFMNIDLLKKFALPRAYLHAAGKWVKEKVENLKTTGTQLKEQFEKINNLAKSGDIDGLNELTSSHGAGARDDGSSMSGFVAGLMGIVRTINMPRAMMHAFGNKVADAFDKVKEDAGKQVDEYFDHNSNVADLSKEGEFIRMWKVDKVSGEGPLKGVFNALLAVSKLVHSPGALIHALGNKISGAFEGFFSKVKKNNEIYHKTVDDIMDKGQKSDLKGIWSTTLNTEKGDLLNPFYTVATGISKVISSVVAVVMYLANKAKWLWDKINPDNWFSSAGDAIANDSTSDSQGSGARDGGGFGPGMLNGHAYYSQNDPRWAGMSYNRSDGILDGATMGDSGCGPTAMSMILSDIQKGDVTPTTLAKFAQASGTRDESGTNYDFIDKSANAFGVSSRRSYNPTPTELTSSLSGSPMVLAGYDDGTGTSPYTDAGHYIVATGIDDYGNIQYSDPRGVEYSGTIDPIDLARSTNASWSFGGYGKKRGGKGRKKQGTDVKKIHELLGGFGPKLDTSVVKTGVTPEDVLAVAINELGYTGKNTIDNINQKGLGAGQSTGDYTKYNQVFGPSVSQAWCAAFVSWCMLQAANGNKQTVHQLMCGCSNLVGCSPMVTAYQNHNRLLDGKEINGQLTKWVKPGDIILSKGKSCLASHIRLVVEVLDDYTVRFIHGNGGGLNCKQVAYGTLKDATAVYFGRPCYDNTSAFSGVLVNTGEPSKYDPSLGVTEEEYNIWTYLRSKEGLSPAAVAGIMGNWEVESNNQSRRIEGDYMKGFPGYDTLTHDRAAMDDWTVNHLFPAYANSGISISKSTYGPHGDGHYYPGIGLAQWTGTRAKALYDFSNQNNKDWSTLDAQLDYFTNGPGEFKYRKAGLREQLNAAQSPEEAARIFGYGFEGNIGGSESKRKAYASNFFNKLSGVTDDYVASNGGSSIGGSFGDKLSSLGSSALGFLGKLGTALSTIGSAMFEDLISGNWKNRNWKETLAAAFAGENGTSSSDYSSDYYGDYSGYYDSYNTSSDDATVNNKASSSMSKLWSIAAGYKNSYNSVKTQFESLSENDKKIVKLLANKYIGVKGNKDKLNKFYQEASEYASIAKTLSNGTAATQFKKSSKYANLTKDELAFITELLNYGKPTVTNTTTQKKATINDALNLAKEYYSDPKNGPMPVTIQNELLYGNPNIWNGDYSNLSSLPTTPNTVNENKVVRKGGSGSGRRGISSSRVQRMYTGGYGPKNDSVSRRSISFSSPNSGVSRAANYYGGYGGNNYVIDSKYDQVLSHIDSVLTAIASNTNNLNLLADIKANTAQGGRGTQTIIQENGKPLTRETNNRVTNNIPNSRPQTQGYPATGYVSNNEKTARAIAFGS